MSDLLEVYANNKGEEKYRMQLVVFFLSKVIKNRLRIYILTL